MVGKSTRIHRYGVGDAIACSSLFFIVCLCLFCFAQPAHSAIVGFDVYPTDPATWTSSSDGYIGVTGNGTLDITDESDVVNNEGIIGVYNGTTGAVTVAGADSTWTNNSYLRVGNYGNGTLDITAGGAVSNSNCIIGTFSDSTGKVTVTGIDSAWTNNEGLYVGNEGNGTLDIKAGATVSNSLASIADLYGSTSKVTVTGAGSTWTNSEYLRVGNYGNGTLNITAGGTVSNAGCHIGTFSGSTGQVTVAGAGSTWTNNWLYVGYEDNATLNIMSDGLVSVAGLMTIDDNADGDGFINMYSGGSLALCGDADDSLASFMGLIAGTDAIRYWDDSIAGWADITGATLGDDYTLSYQVGGDLDGYTLLTVERAMLGDANGDGRVDVSDLGILASNYGTDSGAKWGDGDFNNDGMVDVSDLGALASSYGNTIYGTFVQAVPEPSSIAGLLGLCLAGLLSWGRRK